MTEGLADRVILHCDCNSFFASVEALLDPELKNVPMAVCGSEEDRHGIILAKNEAAKKYNIKTAETVYLARKKCPQLVTVRPHHDAYVEYSRRVNRIYSEYTDLVEPFGIDESWLDITSSTRFFGSPSEIAEEIKRRVFEEIGITLSIGVSFNKVFAKLGSDLKKPNAITYINWDNYKSLVYPLPVGDLLFVGKQTCDALAGIGVTRIGELASLSRERLICEFGKLGGTLYSYANGLDASPVVPSSSSDRKSISNGMTFKRNVTMADEWRMCVSFLCEELGTKLRASDSLCRSVGITIKDEHLNSYQRQTTLDTPTDLADEISSAAFKLLKGEWNEGTPIRTLTVCAQSLMSKNSDFRQLDLLDSSAEAHRAKTAKKEKTLDIIRQKFGKSSIMLASGVGSDVGILPDDDEE